MTICDRVAVLDQGVIQQIGTPVELFDRPANRFVAQFVGSVNLFEGTIERDAAGARFRSAQLGAVDLPAALEAPPAARVELAFRPHAVRFEPAREDEMALEGVVEGAEFLGEFVRYEVRVGNGFVVADLPHHRGGERLPGGTSVSLAVPAREIRLIS